MTRFDISGSRLLGLDGKIGIFNFQGAGTNGNGFKTYTYRSCYKNIIARQEAKVNNFLLSPYLRKISYFQIILQLIYSYKDYYCALSQLIYRKIYGIGKLTFSAK